MGDNHYKQRKKYSDEYLVNLYLKYGSQGRAAEHVDVNRETIARAVRRAGIPMTGRRLNGKNQTQSKISDEELRREALSLTCLEIAKKHKMSEERVYRRARKLGISLTVRGQGGHWYKRAKRYGALVSFDDTITLNAVRKRFGDICQICGKPVDGNAINESGHIRRLYPTVDHIVPLSKGGTYTWDNVQLAHMACNAGKGDKARGA